jgi:hypothetical protein
MSWRSVLLVEKTGVPIESHRPVASNWRTLKHNIEYTTPWTSFVLTKLVVIGTDYTCSCSSMVCTDNGCYRQWLFLIVNIWHVELPHLHVYLLGGEKPRNLIEQNTVWLKYKWNEEINVNCWSKNWIPFRSTWVHPRFFVGFA